MAPDVHRIAVPNPFFEGKNSVYLIKSDPITLIDTGVATEKAFGILSEGLQKHGLGVSDIQRVILTHKHIDHIGNAWRIQEAGNAEVFIHELEAKSLVDVDPSGKRFDQLVADRLEAWHVPPQPPKQAKDKMPDWAFKACEPTAIKDGHIFESDKLPIEVIHTPGHSMGSVCLKFGERLFSGDHVLRAISPNIGAGDLRSKGMLAHFLNSLERVAPLGDIKVFPGHGSPFTGLPKRCEELKKHHESRIEKTLAVVGEGAETVYEVAIGVFGELKDFHVLLGCAEANSHLEYLVAQGAVREDDGRYQASK